MVNPFLPAPSPPASRWISERDFSAVFSAAQFAESFECYFDTSITVSWRLMGVEGDAPTYLAAFTKCLRDWLDKRVLPVAWVYAHECDDRIGLHTHLVLFLLGAPPADRPDLQKLYRPDTAPDYRGDFRAWARGWPERQVGRRTPNAIRVRGPRQETPWLHWLTASYLLKGYDPNAIVQSARNAPDGRAVLRLDRLALAGRWPDSLEAPSGCFPEFGSGAPGPGRAEPGGFDYLFKEPTFQLTADSVPMRLVRPPRPAFRSAYEDGLRDVRRLYPRAFYERVTHLFTPA